MLRKAKLWVVEGAVSHTLIWAGYALEDVEEILVLVRERWPGRPPASPQSITRLLQLPAREVIRLNFEREVA